METTTFGRTHYIGMVVAAVVATIVVVLAPRTMPTGVVVMAFTVAAIVTMELVSRAPLRRVLVSAVVVGASLAIGFGVATLFSLSGWIAGVVALVVFVLLQSTIGRLG